MLILKLIDVNEVELLVRKLPREIVEEHFRDDTDTIEKMLALFPVKKEVVPLTTPYWQCQKWSDTACG